MKSSVPILLAAALLGGCSGTTKPATETAKPAVSEPAVRPTESVFGRAAFQKTFIAARGSQRDAQPYLEICQPTAEATGAHGQAPAWTATYGSAAVAEAAHL